MTVLAKILSWSSTRPKWQRDALRRLVAHGSLTAEDLVELAAICRHECGVRDPAADAAPAPVPLSSEHVAVVPEAGSCVTLAGIANVQHVNALAPGHLLEFSANGLTAVYGDNGSGKSGYARILKKVCRARGGSQKIHDNIFGQPGGGPATATITYVLDGTAATPLNWEDGKGVPAELAGVSVFDSTSAAVYVEDVTDIAFRPFGLDLFSKLAAACDAVRLELQSEIALLQAGRQHFDGFAPGGPSAQLLGALGGSDARETLDRMATLAEADVARYTKAKADVARLDADDPQKRAAECRLRAGRLRAVRSRLSGIEETLSAERVEAVRTAAEASQAAAEAARLASTRAFDTEPLRGVASETWQALWEAARTYSEAEAYPDQAFPVTTNGSVCVLCQQPLATTTADRLRRFEQHVRDETETLARKAAAAMEEITSRLRNLQVAQPDDDNLIQELATLKPQLGDAVRLFLASMAARRQAILAACASSEWAAIPEGAASSSQDLLEVEQAEESEALRLEAARLPEEAKRLREELRGLGERDRLVALRPRIEEEIAREQRVSQLNNCLRSTDTKAITVKSTEVTKEVISKELCDTFDTELRALGLGHLAVAVEPEHGAKGTLYHRVHIKNAKTTNWSIREVLSEGEYRSIALAGFLAELSTQPKRCTAVFDDPVSSLDHVRRQAVARRLAREAGKRQVVILTHDLVFLLYLEEETRKAEVQFNAVHLRRERDGLGVPSNGLPWYGMPVKRRVAVLKTEAVQLKKIHEEQPGEAYEREAAYWWGKLREAWECAVEETLLNGAVRRFGRGVSTKPLRAVTDVSDQDIATIEKGMDECSTWLSGHDMASEANAPMPGPEVFEAAVNALDTWRTAVEKRRKAQPADDRIVTAKGQAGPLATSENAPAAGAICPQARPRS